MCLELQILRACTQVPAAVCPHTHPHILHMKPKKNTLTQEKKPHKTCGTWMLGIQRMNPPVSESTSEFSQMQHQGGTSLQSI